MSDPEIRIFAIPHNIIILSEQPIHYQHSDPATSSEQPNPESRKIRRKTITCPFCSTINPVKRVLCYECNRYI
jgi:hypothetical protein